VEEVDKGKVSFARADLYLEELLNWRLHWKT